MCARCRGVSWSGRISQVANGLFPSLGSFTSELSLIEPISKLQFKQLCNDRLQSPIKSSAPYSPGNHQALDVLLSVVQKCGH